MSRWNPNARGRLEQAALELYSERGFEQTTVADIAAHAGLTERTFFRYFADKREVLFGGAKDLQAFLVGHVARAPTPLASIQAVATAFDAAGIFTAERRAYARQRQRILNANTELQERELMKLASLSSALASLFRERGVSAVPAALTADAGIAVFMAAYRLWIDETNQQSFGQLTQQALEEWHSIISE